MMTKFRKKHQNCKKKHILLNIYQLLKLRYFEFKEKMEDDVYISLILTGDK